MYGKGIGQTQGQKRSLDHKTVTVKRKKEKRGSWKNLEREKRKDKERKRELTLRDWDSSWIQSFSSSDKGLL